MMLERLNVLFVDDEQKIIDGLRRHLRAHREHWDIRFATSGDAALLMLKERPADIIVSDMRMPGMNGGQLLMRVRELYPQTTRVILSGQTDQVDLLKDIGCIHQYLQKPCGGEILCNVLERTRVLNSQLSQPLLRLAANQVNALPPCSETYNALVSELGRDNSSLTKIASLVASDPALAAKLMQLVNSAFFGMPCKVKTPHDAVVLLGLNTVHSIIVAGRLFEFVGNASANQSMISNIWASSVEIGAAAFGFAVANKASSETAAQARLAGMLCLIGRAILLATTPETYEKVIACAALGSISYLQSEKIIYDANQDALTAYALGLWAFPEDLVEAVAFQSEPSVAPLGKGADLVAYLHLARSVHQSRAGGLDAPVKLDKDFLIRRGMDSLIPEPKSLAA
jgi:HD-like signal output (HDOD) protein/CheY-like chemotaxis protein